MKKRDFLLVAVLLLISAAGIFILHRGSGKSDAYIYVNGSLYGRYDLAVPLSIHIAGDNGIVNDIEISDGSIYMKNATCPGKQCMKSGRISRNNESICCAPASLMIIIRSDTDTEYDAITK